LAIGVVVSYLVSKQIISYYQTQPIANIPTSESFLPVIISVGISLLIMTALIPPESQLEAKPTPARQPASAAQPPRIPPA
jgi:hypothetical protein